MRALTAAEVISVWEGASRPLLQALDCLEHAAPERSRLEWARVPFGQCCRALFQLRALMFGPAMRGVVPCPRCGERLEFTFECLQAAVAETGAADVLRIEAGDRSIEMRLPGAGDLLESRSATELLSRCAAEPVEPDLSLIQAASERLAESDPLAETTLDLTCPACGQVVEALLDIAAYLSQEISAEARRLLNEVSRLASAFGWPEQDILALSPARRRAYLELAGV